MQCYVLRSNKKEQKAQSEFAYTVDMKDRHDEMYGDRPLPPVIYKGKTIPSGRFGFRDIGK